MHEAWRLGENERNCMIIIASSGMGRNMIGMGRVIHTVIHKRQA